jgi:hypothetical protein
MLIRKKSFPIEVQQPFPLVHSVKVDVNARMKTPSLTPAVHPAAPEWPS